MAVHRLRAPRARIAAALAAFAIAVGACKDSEPPQPFADIEGTYLLETMNGTALPVPISGAGWLREMRLTMDASGRTIVSGYTQEVQTSDVPTFRQFFSFEGQASRSDSLIRFTDMGYVANGTGRMPTPDELRVTSYSINPVTGQQSATMLFIFRKP